MEPMIMPSCRLCFSTESSLMSIYDDTTTNIPEMLSRHIGEVTEPALLPTFICTACFDKISEFHVYCRDVLATQQHFVDNLVKQEPVDVVELSEAIALPLPPVVEPKCDEYVEAAIAQHSESHAVSPVASKTEVANESDGSSVGGGFDHAIDFDEEFIDEPVVKAELAADGQNEEGHTEPEAFDMHFDGVDDMLNILDEPDEATIASVIAKHFKPTCHLCPTKLPTLELAKSHQRTRHGIRPGFLRCCNIKLTSRPFVVDHVRWHLDPMAFRCSHCGHTFKSRYALGSHRGIAKNPKKFACSNCGFVAPCAQLLVKHFETHHKTAPLPPPVSRRSAREPSERVRRPTKVAVRKMKLANLRERMRAKKTKSELPTTDNSPVPNETDSKVPYSTDNEVPAKAQRKVANKSERKAHKHKRVRIELPSTPAPEPDDPSHYEDLRKYSDMKCDECDLDFIHLQHAKVHYRDHGIDNGYLKCCSTKLHTPKAIADHLAFHQQPDIYKCPKCDRIFNRKVYLQRHLVQHEAMNEERYKCEICHRSYHSGFILKKHKLTHLKKKPKLTIPCDQCQRSFATDEARLAHVKRTHDKIVGGNMAICEFCAKQLSSREALAKHIRNRHTENRERPLYQCDICKKWLTTLKIMREHLDKHMASPQQCPHCDKISPNPEALKGHIKRVHLMKKIFKCDLCNKSFKIALALKDHVATHTGERAFRCTFCPETFIWRPNMYAHQKKAHPAQYTARRRELEAAQKPAKEQTMPSID